MKKHISQILAILLLVAALASLPLSAYADAGVANVIRKPGDTVGDLPASTLARLKNADVGSVITFGKYEQNGGLKYGTEDIAWRVLAKENGRILVISESIIERIPYALPIGYFVPAWDDSTVCLWLNSSFFHNAFTPEEQARIETVTVTNEVRDAQNRIFLLNAPEVKAYLPKEKDRICAPSDYISSNDDWTSERAWQIEEHDSLSEFGRCCWLLRTEGSYADVAAYVDGDGIIREAVGNGLSDYINGVRPAMWIKTS